MTPEQIASTYKGGVRVLRRLQAHGLHVFTDADLRARDERIIRAALHRALSVGVTWPWFDSDNEKQCQFSAIIAAAEDDQ